MKKKIKRGLMGIVLTAALVSTACGGKTESEVSHIENVASVKEEKEIPVTEAEATTMRLTKHEGILGVVDGKGVDMEPRENMKIYSGYNMETEEISYAWINLDDVKLIKMDEITAVGIQKEDKHLELQLKSGSLFFHVMEPLKDDETMKIETSTMIAGIRGTSGWVEADDDNTSNIYVLEGTVEVEAENADAVPVPGGSKATIKVDEEGKTSIVVSEYSAFDIPVYVIGDVEENEALVEEIFEASNMNVRDAQAIGSSYQTIIEEYLSAAEVGYSGENPNIDGEVMRMHEAYGEKLYYAYYDMDENGVEELLIGLGQDDYVQLADVFAYDGEQAVRILDEHVFGERSRLNLMSDGTLYLQGSGSASTGSVTLWSLDSDGYRAETVFDYAYDYQNLENERYYIPGGTMDDVISESEFQTLMADREEVQDISWRNMESGEEIAVSMTDPREAYEGILADYQAACAEDSNDWMSNTESYNQTYSHLGTESLFYYHMGGGQTIFYAYHDVDGNGIEELFIGSGQTAENAYVSTMFAFDGQEAVMMADMMFEVLNDGTILRMGNGGGVEQILQLAEDGYTFIPKSNTGIELNSMIFDQDFSVQGGLVKYEWQPLN